MRSQRAAALVSLVCFVPGAVVALGASYGTRLGWWDYATGLKILAPGFLLALAGAVIGGLWLARALGGNNSAGWKFGVLGLAGSLLVVFVPLNQLRLTLFSPPIHDVSTNPEFPPLFVALLPLRAGAENGPDYDGANIITVGGKRTTVAAAQKKAYPDIKPYCVLLGAVNQHKQATLFWRAFQRAKDLGFAIVAFDEKDGTIEAVHTSFWFGLKQDVAIRVREAGKYGACLDIRVKSRTGVNDAGAAAALVRGYLQAVR
ncbi:MAG: DUF1499 domain-containing protein [Rhizomicrobium sp.]